MESQTQSRSIMKGTIQDAERLISNQKSLLESIPEMVLLVKNGDSIEYMNPSAKSFLGDLTHINDESERQVRLSELLRIVAQAIREDKVGTFETTLGQFHLEYTLAPFFGYNNEALYWFFIRDLTESKRQFEEISLFHTSIETILSHKISELKECDRSLPLN